MHDAPKSVAEKHICVHLRASLRADVRAQRNIEALVQEGFTVSLVDFDHQTSPLDDSLLKDVHITHLDAQNQSGPSSFKPWTLLKLLGMVNRGALHLLRTPADIYHASDLRALPAAYIAACLRRKPLVFETYELPLVQPYLTRHRVLLRVAVGFLKGMMRRCDGVITVSPPIVTELQQRYGGPTAVVVRNIPVYQPSVRSDRLRSFLKLSPETRIALYQGGFQDNRSLDKLIDAARFLAPGNVIVLMGSGELQAQLEWLIDETGVGDRVKIVPAVPYAELLEWTASADIGLTLFSPDWSVSIKLCLPNKLFEYLMAGLPVLTTPLEAIVELVHRYDVGRVVPSLEPETIGKAINAMLADTQALQRMRANALEASATDLRWEHERQQLVTLYKRLLNVPA
jgi:glycosyltransferase involved in cell wall biosynthesis